MLRSLHIQIWGLTGGPFFYQCQEVEKQVLGTVLRFRDLKFFRICILDSNSCFTFCPMGHILNLFLFWISNWHLCKFMSILCLWRVVEYVWFDFLKAPRSLIIVRTLSSAQGFKAITITIFFNSPYYRQNWKLIGMFENNWVWMSRNYF